MVEALTNRGYRVVPVRSSEEGLDLVQRMRFDVVFCSGVLYHVPNMQQSLDQLRQLCRGTLILATASVTERETPNLRVSTDEGVKVFV